MSFFVEEIGYPPFLIESSTIYNSMYDKIYTGIINNIGGVLMRLEHTEYKYGYTLNTEDLYAIVDLSKEIASSIDSEKNIDVLFSLSFEDDTHMDKKNVEELEEIINRIVYHDCQF